MVMRLRKDGRTTSMNYRNENHEENLGIEYMGASSKSEYMFYHRVHKSEVANAENDDANQGFRIKWSSSRLVLGFFRWWSVMGQPFSDLGD